MDSRVPHFSYLGDEIILAQFSLLAENIQKAIGGNAIFFFLVLSIFQNHNI